MRPGQAYCRAVAPRRLLLIALGLIACARSPEPGLDAGPAASVSAAPRPPPPPPPVDAGPRCREQRAQDFLLRKHQLARPRSSAAERRAIEAARARSVEYRTDQYGYFPGVGQRKPGAHSPRYHAETIRLFDLEVTVHRKVVPALRCVQEFIARACADHPYHPRRITGLREHNTYQDYEVSNHLYGIAIDLDSDLNPCCGCVAPWNQNPVCRKKVPSPFERMAMPECWVDAFERHGFYWLGHDELEDTMHFEFLGDPDRILE